MTEIRTDYTLTAGEIIPTMRVAMPHSYRKLFVEAVYAVQGSRVLIVGIPEGYKLGDSTPLTDEQLDARRTYIELRADEPVTAQYIVG